MHLMSAWGGGEFRVGLYNEGPGRLLITQEVFSSSVEECIAVDARHFGQFLDCILEGVANVTAKTEEGYVFSSIIDSSWGAITIGVVFAEGHREGVFVDQGHTRLMVPSEYFDEWMSWMLREFYVLNTNDVTDA